MPSRKVALLDDLSEEKLAQSGVTISTLARIGRIATIPKGFIVSHQVFDDFKSMKEGASERLIPWSVELEVARAFDRLGSSVVNVMPSPSYPSGISGSYVSDKASLVTEIRKTMVEFLSEEEEDFRKGKEVAAYRLAFLVQEIPPHSVSGSVEGAGEGKYDVKALLGLPVDLSSSDTMTIDEEGSSVDMTILSQERKWVAEEAGMEEVEVEKELRRESKVPPDMLKKLSALGERLTRKIGPGAFQWYLKDRIFIVWNVSLVEELPEPAPEPKEDTIEVRRRIPSSGTSIFLMSKSPPESVEGAEIQGLFLVPSEGAQPVADELLRLSEDLRPRPIVVLAGGKGMESLAGARKEGGKNIWPMFGASASHSEEITKSAAEKGLRRSKELPFWLEVGSPTSLLLLKDAAGRFDGVFIPIDEIVNKMDAPEDKRFGMALSAVGATVDDTHERGLVVAIGTSNRERLGELWRYCAERGIDILAVDDGLIEDTLSLWRAEEV
ncbi:MAG: hypothetical protein LN417_10440 [Candidatus Thermoplasmatota archaeon]|nr:hypothetical protein [Candidatus Thermoplasmatota archaeon]